VIGTAHAPGCAGHFDRQAGGHGAAQRIELLDGEIDAECGATGAAR